MTTSYTNAVLTVIALCLLVLTFRSVFEANPASAQVALSTTAPAERPYAAPTPTSKPDQVVKVNIVEIGGWKLLERSALPVEIESGPVPVQIEGSRGVCGCP